VVGISEKMARRTRKKAMFPDNEQIQELENGLMLSGGRLAELPDGRTKPKHYRYKKSCSRSRENTNESFASRDPEKDANIRIARTALPMADLEVVDIVVYARYHCGQEVVVDGLTRSPESCPFCGSGLACIVQRKEAIGYDGTAGTKTQRL